jgi:hypothetical protein
MGKRKPRPTLPEVTDVTRRSFLKYAGVSLAACSMSELLVGCDPETVEKIKEAIRVRVRRPEDLLVFDLQIVNLRHTTDGQLEREDGDEDAFIIVHFPPQHILEEVVPESDADDPPAPPLRSLLSGPSRVAFKLPGGVDSIPYDLVSLLDAIRQYELGVHENASARAGVALPPEPDEEPEEEEEDPTPFTPGDLILEAQVQQNANVTKLVAPGLMPAPVLDFAAPEPKVPAEPGLHDTAIELPTRLLVSPNRHTRFLHQSEPVESSRGRVELWHTRLAALTAAGVVDERATALRTMRALWVRGQPIDPEDPSLDPSDSDPPFEASISSAQRNKIVHQSSNWTQEGVESGDTEPAQPIDVDRMMLTALGGYLESRAEWTEKTDNNLVGWEHRATLGRDHYVKIVEAGYLYPWGNRAALVQISERRIHDAPQTAYLWKRAFLVIKEPVRRFVPEDPGPGIARTLRQLPFTSIEFRQLVTPNLDLPDAQEPFVPSLGGRTYRFPVHLLDKAGKLVTADVAGVWVPGAPSQTWAMHGDDARDLFQVVEGSQPLAYTPLLGQRVTLAPGGGGAQNVSDNTTFEATSVLFDADDLDEDELDDSGLGVPFLPRITEAELAVEAARAFAGADDALAFKYAERYVEHGFDPDENAGEILLELMGDEPLGVDFGSQSDKSGGFLTPSMQITGLSRAQGAVSGSLDTIADGDFDPEEFFKDALPKLFGVIPLTEILQLGAGLGAAPKLVTDVMDEVQAFLADLSRLQAQLGIIADEVDDLASDVEDVLEQIGAVITALGEAALDPSDIEPGGLLDELRAALQELDQSIAEADGVPPGALRVAREALARVLEVLAVADQLLNAIERFQEAQELIKNRTVRLEFRPKIQADPLSIFKPGREDGLLLAAEIRAKASGSKPAGADLICSLEDFKIQLIGDDPVFAVDFERMQFIVRTGKKPDIDVVLNGLVFGGPLSFVERIKEIIPLDGFSDPPALDVGLDGIRASFSLPLPNVAVGIFALENISINAGFHIPFLGDAITLNFGFCSRENPFSLTVAMLGGGGFVGLEIAPDGVRLLEISLEFGASLAVDFCVVSGGVEIKAGIYFALEGHDVTLCGYLRIRGHVQVLGLIGASIELAMELTYQSASGKVIGRASLRIEITLLCFSVGVTLTVERKFAGSNGDPTFAEVFQPLELPASPTEDIDVPDTPWARYVNAFAL